MLREEGRKTSWNTACKERISEKDRVGKLVEARRGCSSTPEECLAHTSLESKELLNSYKRKDSILAV